MKEENDKLLEALDEKDYEIKKLKKKVELNQEHLALFGQAGLPGDMAATKIIELSKKIRDMSTELEREKLKTRQSSNRVRDLEREVWTEIDSLWIELNYIGLMHI